MTDYTWRCTCPLDEQCTCGAILPEYGELLPPFPPIPLLDLEDRAPAEDAW